MKTTREQLTAELLARIDAQREDVVEWAEAHPTVNLTEIEKYALRVDEEVRDVLAGAVMSHKESRQVVQVLLGEASGQPTQYKGLKRKPVITRQGAIDIDRAITGARGANEAFSPWIESWALGSGME
jgi:Asp-tRNA(Asn)/Glu-tRNA(Gln) amidotransferase A subunit family amidase